MSGSGMSTVIDLMRVFMGIAFLCYASYTDIKIRKVKNEVWLVMGATGGIFLLLQLLLERRDWEYFLIFIPVTILFTSMFWEHKPLVDLEKKRVNFGLLGLYTAAVVTVLFQIAILWGDFLIYQLLSIPVMILVFFLMYQLNLIHGGADAKALMTIAIFMPFYPDFFDFPLLTYATERNAEAMELFFPFALLVLMNSVIFVIWVLLAFLLFNASKKDFGFPEMFIGYRMDINDVENRFVWPMERVVDGERVIVLLPKITDRNSLGQLKEMGVNKIWVTPKIPFIVAIAGGFVLTIFVGNIIGSVIGFFLGGG
jgi:preflagellin peptidase FlaK